MNYLPLILVMTFHLAIHSASASELKNIKQELIEKDHRNTSVDFSFYQNGEIFRYCIENLSDQGSSMDVFRILLQAADNLKNKQFSQVELCFRGSTIFILPGEHFSTIGKEFETQNPMYTVRTFPEKLKLPNGENAFKKHSGGTLYLMRVQMADFKDMNSIWYLEELISEKKSETDKLRPTEFSSEEEIF